jgi:hypothetical protein
MMQTTEPWRRQDMATYTVILLCLSTARSSLCQSKMSSTLVVIADVVIHESFQMPHIEDDHVIQQMRPVLHGNSQIGRPVYILDLTADRYFGESQVVSPSQTVTVAN